MSAGCPGCAEVGREIADRITQAGGHQHTWERPIVLTRHGLAMEAYEECACGETRQP